MQYVFKLPRGDIPHNLLCGLFQFHIIDLALGVSIHFLFGCDEVCDYIIGAM